MLTRLCFGTHTAAEFIDPGGGDKADSGIGLSYWPALLHGLAVQYDNPMPELTLSPQSEIYEFGYCCTSIFVD